MIGSPWRFQLSELSTLCLQQFVHHPGTGSLMRLHLHVSVFTCLSSFGHSGLPYVIPSPMDPRGVGFFSVCSGFYLLLGQRGDF